MSWQRRNISLKVNIFLFKMEFFSSLSQILIRIRLYCYISIVIVCFYDKILLNIQNESFRMIGIKSLFLKNFSRKFYFIKMKVLIKYVSHR